LVGQFQLFGSKDLQPFFEASKEWSSFEQFAAWSFLQTESMAQKDNIETLVVAIVSSVDTLGERPESCLGALTVLSGLNLTTQLLLEVLSSNSESPLLFSILECVAVHNEYSILERLIIGVLGKFSLKQSMAEMFNDGATVSLEKLDIVLKNTGKLIQHSLEISKKRSKDPKLVINIKKVVDSISGVSIPAVYGHIEAVRTEIISSLASHQS
jgi:hypothetical protein